jgi:hypothetical protein
MNIDKMIEQWEEKHSSLLKDYSKGNANNEVMQMYRSQMKNVLDFIEQLKQVKNNSVLADVSGMACKCGNKTFTHRHSNWIECTACNKINVLQA